MHNPPITLPAFFSWLLPLPATLDWLTQTLKKRVSTTPIRLVTGMLFGIWLGDLLRGAISGDIRSLYLFGLQIIIYMAVVMLILFKYQGIIDSYLKPYEDFIEDYRRQKTHT